MTPEDKLCLLLARGHLTPDLRQRILEFLASALQWPLVLERAYTHQVYPLVYRPFAPKLTDRDLLAPPVVAGFFNTSSVLCV